MIRVFIFCIAFVFIIGEVYTQNEEVNCVILDNYTKPVSNANIRAVNHSYGCISSEYGFFSIPLNILPVELEISHIGYQTKRITLSDSAVNRLNDLFKISLQHEIHVFNEVEILNQKTKLLSKRENRWSIIDYCISNDYALALYMKGGNRKIKYISLLNSTSFEKSLNIKAHKITIDHLGNTFLLLREQAVQFALLENDSIYLFPTISINYFDDNIQPILGIVDSYLVFNSLNMHNQKICYWSGNQDERHLIYEIYNKDRYAFAQGIIDEQQQLLRKYGRINEMGDMSVGDLKIARRMKRLNWTYSLIGTIPEYSPAYIKQDTIFIFDHVNSSILGFDVYGNLLDSVKIDYHLNKKWKKEIFYDQKQQLFYTKLIKNGKISLYLINTKTGEVSITCDIDGTVFPEKMIVYDDKVYYMSFDINHQKFLVQQKLHYWKE